MCGLWHLEGLNILRRGVEEKMPDEDLFLMIVKRKVWV
jgi:hypothetical protein